MAARQCNVAGQFAGELAELLRQRYIDQHFTQPNHPQADGIAILQSWPKFDTWFDKHGNWAIAFLLAAVSELRQWGALWPCHESSLVAAISQRDSFCARLGQGQICAAL